MAVSVVVSQIAFSDDGQYLHVKGTVATNPLTTSLKVGADQLVSQIQNGTANAVATAYLNRYNNITAAIASIASTTINYHAQESSGIVTAIVFGSTPVAIVGYEYLEITATVGGTSTILHLSQDLFLEYFYAGDLSAELGKRFVQQASQNTQIASGIATFSI